MKNLTLINICLSFFALAVAQTPAPDPDLSPGRPLNTAVQPASARIRAPRCRAATRPVCRAGRSRCSGPAGDP